MNDCPQAIIGAIYTLDALYLSPRCCLQKLQTLGHRSSFRSEMSGVIYRNFRPVLHLKSSLTGGIAFSRGLRGGHDS